MSTTTPSRTSAGGSGTAAPASAAARGHLRLVPPPGPAVTPAEVRARAAHPAGSALRPAGPRALAGPRPGPAPLRLTRRGRLVLRGLVVALLLAALSVTGLALARGARAADGPASPVVVATRVVLPGETLWGIARQVAPHEDPRDTVARIVEFNSLTSVEVQAGQRLALPPGLSSP